MDKASELGDILNDEYFGLESKLEELTDRHHSLCANRVWGYVLGERTWGMFTSTPEFSVAPLLTSNLEVMLVSGLSEPVFDPTVIDKVVLRVPSNIGMIKSLCEPYSRKHDEGKVHFADFIRGKGEGNILLLHGPPGTGKTLTAGKHADRSTL
jgi:hypothetical protein